MRILLASWWWMEMRVVSFHFIHTLCDGAKWLTATRHTNGFFFFSLCVYFCCFCCSGCCLMCLSVCFVQASLAPIGPFPFNNHLQCRHLFIHMYTHIEKKACFALPTSAAPLLQYKGLFFPFFHLIVIAFFVIHWRKLFNYFFDYHCLMYAVVCPLKHQNEVKEIRIASGRSVQNSRCRWRVQYFHCEKTW